MPPKKKSANKARKGTRMIAFQADPVASRALEKLEAAAGPGTVRVRSTVIRRAIIEAAARLDDRSGVS
jgi:hypothetical protein